MPKLSVQRRRPRSRSSNEYNFPNFAILNLNFGLRLLERRWWCFWRRAQPGVSCRRYPGSSEPRDLTVTTARIASGSGPSTAWYLGVVPAPKAGPKCPKVTSEN